MKKMKLCVLGNSHVASLKSGWDFLKQDYTDFDATFFAARGETLSLLRLQHDSLVCEKLASKLAFTSNGLKSIHLIDYDIFVVYGLGFYVPRIDFRYSKSLISHVILDCFTNKLNGKISSLIRQATNNPIYNGHCPQPIIANSMQRSINDISYKDTIRLINSDLPISNLTVLAQPHHTLTDGWHTDNSFSQDAPRLNLGDLLPNKQKLMSGNNHMNAEFGILWLTQLFELITKNYKYT